MATKAELASHLDFLQGFIPDSPSTEDALSRIRRQLLKEEVFPAIKNLFRGEQLIGIDKYTFLHGFDLRQLIAISREIGLSEVMEKLNVEGLPGQYLIVPNRNLILHGPSLTELRERLQDLKLPNPCDAIELFLADNGIIQESEN